MYIARHYVRVNGKMFTPGEVITEAIPNDKAIRLAALNAIDKIEAAPIQNERGPAPDGKQEDDKTECSAPVASGLPVPEEDDGENDTDDTDDAEDEEEAEVPEIDVTDGIVAETEPEAPAATPRKRSSKKK